MGRSLRPTAAVGASSQIQEPQLWTPSLMALPPLFPICPAARPRVGGRVPLCHPSSPPMVAWGWTSGVKGAGTGEPGPGLRALQAEGRPLQP